MFTSAVFKKDDRGKVSLLSSNSIVDGVIVKSAHDEINW